MNVTNIIIVRRFGLKPLRVDIKESHCVKMKTPKLSLWESREEVRELFADQGADLDEPIIAPIEPVFSCKHSVLFHALRKVD